MFYSYNGVNTKTCYLGFPSAKLMLQVLVSYLSKFCCRKETWGYAKVIYKKEKKREMRKNRQVSELLKQWVLRWLPEKRRRDE